MFIIAPPICLQSVLLNLTKFTGQLEEKEYETRGNGKSVTLMIFYSSSFVITYFEEYPIIDTLGMIGSIGGSLGICVGFSIYDILSYVVDKAFLFKK